jgi:penicillin amidase
MMASSKMEDFGFQVFNGSNNWVISGSKTTSGKPILANDMHLRFSAPGVWYQIHEKVPGKLNVTGVALPGQPFIISGHNDSIAWGLTNVMNDDIDFYRETINPDSTEYRLDGKWKALVVKHEVFAIRGGDTVRMNLRFTHRGPIISTLKNLRNESVSMRWMGNEMSNELQSMYLVDRAHNWKDFCGAMKSFNSVSQNVAYADERGNIGMYCCAGVPIRKGNPIAVLPGDTSDYDWQGIVPFEQLPHKLNPPEGFAASANNRTIDTLYSHYISSWFDLSFRYNRICEMLSTDKRLSVSDIATIQTNFTSKMPEFYVPAIVEVIKRKKDLTTNAYLALTALEHWNGLVDAQSQPAALFEVFYNQFIENVVKDEMGDTLFKEFLVDKILTRNTIQNIWVKKGSVLCDDITTPNKVETFSDMVVKSFEGTLKYMDEKCGRSFENWRWGKIHTFTIEHPLGKKKILNKIFRFNRGPYEVGGSFHTIAPYSYQYAEPFKVNSGASQRQIYDFSNWDNSISVIPTGNCGIPASHHYCDQTRFYIAGKYHMDLFSDSIVHLNYQYRAIYTPGK